MIYLAIESSCDETSAAVIKDGTTICSNVVASSSLMHEKYGGIVPEVASREQVRCILPVITEALRTAGYSYKTIDAVAVAVGPGLIGSLLIGVEAAKTIAFITNKPIIPVNHVLAHIYANFLAQEGQENRDIQFPAIALVVSGGHTELFLMHDAKKLQWLGGTIDDAAGEAFDKTARLLGFGSRGGLAIQEAAKNYVKTSVSPDIRLPRPILHDGTLNFSFSGLKTAILREVTALRQTEKIDVSTVCQLSHEVQESITDVLVKKTMQAADRHNAASILIGGGVSANIRLREKFRETIQKHHVRSMSFFAPPVALSTDNAAYIGSYAFFRGTPVDWHGIEATPDLSVEVNG